MLWHIFVCVLVPEVDYKYLLFEDHLVTTSDTGKELGEFKVHCLDVNINCM